MSTITFKRGTSVDMNGTPITNGMLYFNTTDHKIYMDTDTERLQYGGDTTLISNPTQASSDNAFNASASVNLFTQKTTVVDSKASALAVTNQYIPLGCLAFKEAIGTTNYSHVGNGTLSGAVVSNYNSIVSHTNSINNLNTVTATHTNQLTAGASGIGIYMDYQNGKFGYNTSAGRGADTFHPFRGMPDSVTFSYTLEESNQDTSVAVVSIPIGVVTLFKTLVLTIGGTADNGYVWYHYNSSSPTYYGRGTYTLDVTSESVDIVMYIHCNASTSGTYNTIVTATLYD